MNRIADLLKVVALLEAKSTPPLPSVPKVTMRAGNKSRGVIVFDVWPDHNTCVSIPLADYDRIEGAEGFDVVGAARLIWRRALLKV